MAETIVYGCDWCGEIIPKAASGEPCFTAEVSTKKLLTARLECATEKICVTCAKALEALRAGRYRR